jgi:hypothetical protein
MIEKKSKEDGSGIKKQPNNECPEKLVQIIETLSLVPLTIKMRNFAFFMGKRRANRKPFPPDFRATHEGMKAWDSIELEEKRDEFNKCIKPLPKEFHNYIFSFEESRALRVSDLSLNQLRLITAAYMQFYRLREDVKKFAIRIDRERKGELIDWETETMLIDAQILRDETGNEYLTGLAGVIGTFRSDRLRICQSCARLFWAKREDSKACSPRCLNNLHVRKSRSAKKNIDQD